MSAYAPSAEEHRAIAAELKLLHEKKHSVFLQMAQMKKQFGLSFYRPHAKQELFHRAAGFKRRMVTAGNKFGKSTCGAAEDASWMLGERLFYPKTDPCRTLGIPQGRPRRILVIATDWDVSDDIFTSQRGDGGMLWQMLPRGYIVSTRRNHSGAIDTMEGSDGSIIKIDTVKSFITNPQGSESADYDAVHVDEPMPEDMWDAVARGLVSRNGSAWFLFTGLQYPWIYDMFFPKRGDIHKLGVTAYGTKWAFRGTIYDNPMLSPEAITEFASGLSEEVKQCRLFGIPLELSGLVYKAFDYDRHVLKEVPKGWKAYDDPPENATIYYWIDPHPKTPHAVLFAALLGDERIYFYDEIFEHCTIEELAHKIQRKVGNRFVNRVGCDPLAYIESPITGTSMADELAANGIYVERATKTLAHGILRVEAELKQKDRLYFSPELTETLYEFAHYTWDTKKDKATDKPKDKDDHQMENLYRMLLDDLEYIKQEEQASKPVEPMELGPGSSSYLDNPFAL